MSVQNLMKTFLLQFTMTRLSNDAIAEGVKQRYLDIGVRIDGVYDALPANCCVYGQPCRRFGWAYVLFQLNDGIAALKNSRLMIIDRRSGRVVYDGSSSDES